MALEKGGGKVGWRRDDTYKIALEKGGGNIGWRRD